MASFGTTTETPSGVSAGFNSVPPGCNRIVLSDAVMRLLGKELDERFQTAAEFAAALPG